ncbi:hypothetical protein phiK7A1_108 [Pseudomonas phage phiK7A1]|uniref:Uncharacterized protein n=1 Tax=Pseudomonas phage phiK7A1 TaxID=2759194 RepID=A0A7H0XFV6_9CAUD|nr:hypothetical protein phiK7A1_108 [Pseudomonas phage phiK7A1]
MFKVNDKVVIVKTDFCSEELANGQTGVITRSELISRGRVVYGVLMDNGYTPFILDSGDDTAWNFFADQLELTE